MSGILMPYLTILGQGAARIAALPNIQFWYDASSNTFFTPTTPSDGADITQWTSKVAGGRNANPIGGTNKPTYEENQAKDGLPAVEFLSTDGLQLPLDNTINAIPGYTFFIVARANGSSQKFVSLDNGELQFGVNSSGNYEYEIAGGSATGPANDLEWKVHTIWYDGTRTDSDRLRHRCNGVQESLTTSVNPGTVSLTDATTVEMYLGRLDTGGDYLQGHIAEVMLTTTALSSGEVIAVENYLREKWIPAS